MLLTDALRSLKPSRDVALILSVRSTVLELDPESDSAAQTHIQILLSLDRYKDALSFITAQQGEESNQKWRLEQAYALYKLGKVPEASKIVEAIRADSMQLDEEGDFARALDVLDAQVVGISFRIVSQSQH